MISKILHGWENTPEWETPKQHKSQTKVSVLIACRNEQDNISSCVESILTNDYPTHLFEIIVINDRSTDNTAQQLKNIDSTNLIVIDNTQKSGKKGALQSGIEKATGTFIITTDADCIVGPEWISSIVSLYEKSNADLISGPIKYNHDKSLIQRFQYIDGINNMAVTANGISTKEYYLANGANLSYRKTLFEEIGGFENDNHASGDDTYMIQMAAKLGSQIRFIKSKDAIVLTQPETDYTGLKHQRKRWATKTSNYPDKRIMKIQGYVFFFILLLLFNLGCSFFGSGLPLCGCLFALFIKLAIDYMYLSKIDDYFEGDDALKSFIPASFMFIAYILTTGYWALMPSKYDWKGRNVK